MLKKITLKNFKGIKDEVAIDLAPITLLFGPNSAGKSTIIQALHYAYEIFVRNNLDPHETELGGDVINLGGFYSMVHNHNLELPIEMRFDFEVDGLPSKYDFDASQLQLEYLEPVDSSINKLGVKITLRWDHGLSKVVVDEVENYINDEKCTQIKTEKKAGGKTKYAITQFNKSPKFISNQIDDLDKIFDDVLGNNLSYLIDDFTNLVFVSGSNENPNLNNITQPINNFMSFDSFIDIEPYPFEDSYSNPEFENIDALREIFNKHIDVMVNAPALVLKNFLKNNRYIGPIRKVPGRNFTPYNYAQENRWADGLGAWDYIYKTDQKFLEEINKWIYGKDKLNTGYQLVKDEYCEIPTTKMQKVQDAFLKLFASYHKGMETALDDDRFDFNPFDWEDKITEVINIDENWDKSINLIVQISSILKNKKDKKLYLKDSDGTTLQLHDVGVGISQIIPVIVGILLNKNSLLSVEQPELHIHPKMQTELGDLLIEQINKNQKKPFFLIETHSEHLMLRLLRRIREKSENKNFQIKPEDISIITFQKNHLGETYLKQIKVNEKGRFDNRWPDGFFEERRKELF